MREGLSYRRCFMFVPPQTMKHQNIEKMEVQDKLSDFPNVCFVPSQEAAHLGIIFLTSRTWTWPGSLQVASNRRNWSVQESSVQNETKLIMSYMSINWWSMIHVFPICFPITTRPKNTSKTVKTICDGIDCISAPTSSLTGTVAFCLTLRGKRNCIVMQKTSKNTISINMLAWMFWNMTCKPPVRWAVNQAWTLRSTVVAAVPAKKTNLCAALPPPPPPVLL